jgi:hypothetical protein
MDIREKVCAGVHWVRAFAVTCDPVVLGTVSSRLQTNELYNTLNYVHTYTYPPYIEGKLYILHL